MKNIKENDTIRLNDEGEAFALFKKVDADTIWQNCYTYELEAVEIPNAPICIAEVKAKFSCDLSVSDDSIFENMESFNLGVKVPFENGYHGYPLGDTAYGSLIQRAGYGASPVLMTLNDKASQNMMPPARKAEVINLGLECYKNRVLVMIRDEKIRAVHSGDESDYSRLPMSELARILRDELLNAYSDIVFSGAGIDHYFTTIEYVINDAVTKDAIEDVFDLAMIDTHNMELCVKLITSDVGISGANLYPCLKGAGKLMMLGTPMVLTHKHKHSPKDFAENVRKVASMFKDATSRLAEMEKKVLKNPEGCFLRLAKQIGFGKIPSVEAASSFVAMYGTRPSQLDLYWALQELYEGITSAKNINEQRKITLQENLARLAFGDLEGNDLPFNWE